MATKFEVFLFSPDGEFTANGVYDLIQKGFYAEMEEGKAYRLAPITVKEIEDGEKQNKLRREKNYCELCGKLVNIGPPFNHGVSLTDVKKPAFPCGEGSALYSKWHCLDCDPIGFNKQSDCRFV